MRAKVNNIYQYSKSNNLPLLGSANYDFWTSYVSAHNVYDRYFRDKFFSWFYWLNFDENTSTADIYDDFVEAVESFLTINNKRYSELYRVQVLAANAYDIVNNYDLTETHTASRSESATDISGQRTDTTTNSTTDGARQDTTSRTFVDGEREDETSVTTVDGARSDSGSTTVGAATNTSEKEIAGFNSSDYSDADKQTDILGTHTDTTSVSKGAQTNTNDTTLNKGEQTNTDNSTFSKGAQLNSASGSAVKGQETDTHSLTGSENISIRRTGNIGVQTAADVIGGHIQLWTSFNFYKMVFDEIAKEFLLLDQCYDTNSGGTITNENAIMDELHKLEAKINLTAKSSELAGLAKTSDLAGLAKSSELAGLAKSSELAGLAKSSELAGLAKTSDLAGLAKTSDLTGLAKSSELAGLAKTSDLTGLAKSSELTGLATSAQAGSISLSIESLRASTLAYKNDIIDSIEGVSENEY